MEKYRVALLAIPSAVLGGYAVWQACKYARKRFTTRILNTGRQPDRIHIVTTPAEWELLYPTIVEHTSKIKVLGLDCEWVFDRVNGIVYPVALLQLATHQGLCILIRFNLISKNIPKSLLKILGDKSILKVGVAVKDDGKKLYKDYGIIVLGCVDLRHILSRVRGHYNCKSRGLKGLADEILGFAIQKDPAVRCGNWEAEKLSIRQVEYAALDALVGIDIYIKLIITRLLGYIPNNQQLDVQAFSIADFCTTSGSVCQGLVDIVYKRNVDDLSMPHQTNNSHNKTGRVDMARSYSTRQRPLYHNCHLEAPDGQMLCTCDLRKAEWYVTKGLGVKINDDPLTVRLKFEPSGRPDSENNYYLQDKDNICVVCGRSESYIRKFIVPQEYRKFFPYVMKAHTSHDVLLLCPSCHQISSQNDADFRLQLAVECEAPLESGSSAKSTQDQGLHKIKAAAKALTLNSRSKIPKERIDHLEKTVKDHFGVDALTYELLEEVKEMDIRIYNVEYIPHAKRVVDHMKDNGGLLEFEKRWRKHFVGAMKPEYLPPCWSVEHTHQQVVKLISKN